MKQYKQLTSGQRYQIYGLKQADLRHPDYIKHTPRDLLSQHTFQIASGYMTSNHFLFTAATMATIASCLC